MSRSDFFITPAVTFDFGGRELELDARRRVLSCGPNIHSGSSMLGFFRRLYLHYGIYRRYPLAPFPALKNAWRIART
jgi:hypothetical protein